MQFLLRAISYMWKIATGCSLQVPFSKQNRMKKMMMMTRRNKRNSVTVLSMAILLLVSSVSCSKLQDLDVGINYGRIGFNLPPPEKIPSLLNSLSVKHVKTFDMDPRVLEAFANTGISLSPCIPNQKIPSLATNFSAAETLVKKSILPFHKNTIITLISVGNEVSLDPNFSRLILPAMRNLHRALRRWRLHKQIKVSTTHSRAILADHFPPSHAVFQESIGESVLKPILKFLKQTESPFMVNLYPYLAYKESYPSIPLKFSLFQPRNNQKFRYTDSRTGLVYNNLFDIMVDAMNSAVKSLGFPDTPMIVSETGWPTNGGPDDFAASLENARVFNQRLTEHITKEPIRGTPLRPGVRVPAYIFSLFDEEQKTGAAIEKHWGILFSNGTKKYNLRPAKSVYGAR